MRKVLFFVSCIILILCFSFSIFAKPGCVSWYCTRKKDNTQPNLPSELTFVKNYELYWCDSKHKEYNSEDKVIYLTFDAGYENGNIEKILDVLKSENVKATFFILDNMIRKNKDLVAKMIEDGHIVANHTMKHKDMTKIGSKEEFAKELSMLEDLYKETFNKDLPKYYRPPEGKISEENLVWAKELGYKTVMWSFAYADWDNGKQPSREYAMKKIMENLHNGEVMLLHPTSSTNAEIMKELILDLKSKGYRFETVDALCQH